MPTTPEHYHLFVGVDSAATTAPRSWLKEGPPATKGQTSEQTPEGLATLPALLKKSGGAPNETLMVLEATGAYWATFATYFVRQGYQVSGINPIQSHHFAKVLRHRAKTDAIDAQMFAQLAATLQPKTWTPPPALYEELYQRLTQRDALLGMQNQGRNQRHALLHGPVIVARVVERLNRLDEQLATQIREIDTELEAVLAGATTAAREGVETIGLLQTIPGVGVLTALWLVVSTLNFTTCATPEQAAAYAGLAPIPRQSGTSMNKRPCIGHSGNGRLRTAFYRATLSGARFNPALKIFYERLLARGKPKKVARCAVARKLFHQAWAIATKRCSFDTTHHLVTT